jgi:hypothetical protein
VKNYFAQTRHSHFAATGRSGEVHREWDVNADSLPLNKKPLPKRDGLTAIT